MFAFVSLTPDEVTIARAGWLPEPSFRPWPNSEREREMEEEAARELGPDDFDQDDGAQDAPEPGEISFDRVVSAEYWKQHGVLAALFVAGMPGDQHLIGVGTVEGSGRTRQQGVRKVEVRVGRMAPEALALSGVVAALTPSSSRVVEGRLTGPMRALSRVAGGEVAEAVETRMPGLRQEMTALVREAQLRRHALRRRKTKVVPVQDAAATALHLFTSQWHKLEPVHPPHPSELARRLADLAPRREDDVISDDASVFPDWERAAYPMSGWWEFHHGDRRLLVKNINVSPEEAKTGADLVYVRTDPDAFVLVQYKLVPVGRDGRPYYRVDKRLPSQIARMQSLETAERGPLTSDVEDDYRLGDGFTFVKFVHSEDSMLRRPGELAAGSYMPTEFVRRMLLSPSQGPAGGPLHYVSEKRSLSPENFAHLVRHRWIGSTGSATRTLTTLFGLADAERVVLAVEEPR